MHFCVFLVVFGLCLGKAVGSYRVLGWKVDRYNIVSTRYLSTGYRFGDTAGGGTWLTWGQFYCWAPELGEEGYCYLRIKFTKATHGGHYQIMGGRTRFMDLRSRYSAGESTWGITTVGEEVSVCQGYTWVGSWVNGRGYAYRYFFVQWTEEPSLTQAFANQHVKHDKRHLTHTPVVFGNTRNGQETFIDEFQSYTGDFHDSSVLRFMIYAAPTTLENFEPQMDQKILINSNEGTSGERFKERVMVNDGCGDEYVEGQTGTLTTSQSITLEESVSYTESFEFGFSITYEASFDIGAVSNSLTVSSEFKYSKSSEFSSTQSNTEESQYVWPTFCKPGNKCKTTLYVTKMLYQIPVIFTFKRNGETFTETNTMQTHVETWHDKVWKPEPTGTICKK